MKKRVFFSWAVLVSMIMLFATTVAEGVDMHEGEWEYTSEVVMEGIPFSVPPTTMRQCLSKKDLVPKTDNDKDCVVKNQQTSGNTVRWTIICKDSDGTSEGKGVITYSGNSYKGTIKMTATDKGGSTEQMTMRLTGRYLGPCSKETMAAEEAREKQIKEAEKAGKAAMAKYQKDREESRRKAEAIIAKVKVPNEDRDACVFDTESPKNNKECDSIMGELNLRLGTWKVEKETAAKTGINKKEAFYMVMEPESGEGFLSPGQPLPKHIPLFGCEHDKIVFKRSGNRITWRHKCDYPNKREITGGIVFNGNSYEGGIIETLYSGKEITTMYTHLSGKLVKEGRSFSRAYTSDRDVSDRAKDADNPIRSIKKLFGW